MGEYQKLLKRVNGEGSSDDILQLKSGRVREAKLPGVISTQQTKNVKPLNMVGNLYQSIAAHFTM